MSHLKSDREISDFMFQTEGHGPNLTDICTTGTTLGLVGRNLRLCDCLRPTEKYEHQEYIITSTLPT